MKTQTIGIAAVLAFLGPWHSAGATDLGFIAYPIGVNTVANGIVPKPGETWLQSYNVFYHADSFKDGKGADLVPGFEANIAASAARVFHTWDTEIGPFTWSSAFVLPLVRADVSTAFSGSTDFGVGDLTLSPVYLGWSNPEKNFFAYGGVDFYIPTKSDVSNDVFSFVPNMNLTWFATSKLEFSTSFGAEFHTTNTDTDYHSGSLAYLEWALNYRAFESLPALTVGVQGYALKQFTDDKIAGSKVGDGFRSQALAVGPQITYNFGDVAVAVRWDHEFDVKNRPEGDKFWIAFNVPLNSGP